MTSRRTRSSLVVGQLSEADLAVAVYQFIRQLSFLREHQLDLLLDGTAGHELVDEHVAVLADAKRAVRRLVRRLVLDRGVPPDAPRLERDRMKTSASQGWPGEHGVGGHHQIAAMRTRIPSGPVFDTAAWRGRVRACGSRRGERRVGGHGSRAAGAAPPARLASHHPLRIPLAHCRPT